MEMIKFEGREFPSIMVNLPFGERKISTLKLNKCLMDYDGSYVSEEARYIDEKIFYFVDEKFLHLHKKVLSTKIFSEL